MVKLVDMERTAAEKKAAEEQMKADYSDAPDYPWGLSLSLGKDELEKIGIKNLPEIGAEMQLVCVAKVTSVSSSASERDEHRCVGLQVVKLGVESDPTTSAARKLYGSDS